jgi:hypothetical protein
MDELLTGLGFKDFTHYKSGTEAYPKCLTDATIDILTKYPDEPVLILEDDVEFTGVSEFDLVNGADAIYLGNSRSGGHPTENLDYKECVFEPYSNTQVRIRNMLATHAIVYISKEYKNEVIRVLSEWTGYNDVAISRIQSSFKILANKRPSFFQSAKFNTGTHEQTWTDFELVSPTLHLIATNKYIDFLPTMIKSAYTHFFPKTQRHIVIYTNMRDPEQYVKQYDNDTSTIIFHYIDIEHEPWPFVTLKRFHQFSRCKLNVSHSFYCDVDAYFTKTLETDRLDDMLHGVEHPIYKGGKGTVCSNPGSLACIPFGMNSCYFCGGFFGGNHLLFMQMAVQLRDHIQLDMDNGVVADWHDESHLNWYFWKNPPDIFHYPFAVGEPDQPDLATHVVFIDKGAIGGHHAFRATPPRIFKPKEPRSGFSLTSSGFRLK